MRATLASPSLARYAGQFVWLELDFDKPENQAFIARHGASYTPTFYILDPNDEHATASQPGAMTLAEIVQFLERGASGMKRRAVGAADAALARGDELMGRDQPEDAAAAYRESLRLAGSSWAGREQAVGSLIWTLMLIGHSRECAEMAAVEAPTFPRNGMFGRVVLAGFSSVNGESEPWAEAARKVLRPLAVEAISLNTTAWDHRFKLYEELMGEARHKGEETAVTEWGERWLKDIESSRPANDFERTALDIARVDATMVLHVPNRVLPALIESERAMPDNYNASLRLAQVENQANHYDEAVRACDRGLVHVTGPLGRSWLLQVKATALLRLGNNKEAQVVLEAALKSAKEIGNKSAREHNINRITNLTKTVGKTQQ
jgi:hypothetical protein